MELMNLFVHKNGTKRWGLLDQINQKKDQNYHANKLFGKEELTINSMAYRMSKNMRVCMKRAFHLNINLLCIMKEMLNLMRSEKRL